MEIVLIETASQIITTLFVMLIGVLGTWLTARIGQNKKLEAINAAQQQLIACAQITVEELMQTVVADLKATREDGKLTESEIASLGHKLLVKTKEKMSVPAMNLLTAAAVDVNALIKGAGESWINALKNTEV